MDRAVGLAGDDTHHDLGRCPRLVWIGPLALKGWMLAVGSSAAELAAKVGDFVAEVVHLLAQCADDFPQFSDFIRQSV